MLNLDRQHSRACLAHAIGTSVAMGSKRVPAALFDGVCDSPEEAAELAFRVNIERDRAKFARMAKRGPAGILGAAR